MGTRPPGSILVHDLLAIKISEPNHCIEFKFQCQINHDREWIVEFQSINSFKKYDFVLEKL